MVKKNRNQFRDFRRAFWGLGVVLLAGLNAGAAYLPLPESSMPSFFAHRAHAGTTGSAQSGRIPEGKNAGTGETFSGSSKHPQSGLDRLLEMKWRSHYAIATSS